MLKSILRIIAGVAVVLTVLWVLIAQPTFRSNDPSSLDADPERLESHVVMLSERCYPRDYQSIENLNRAADYIEEEFRLAGAAVESQPFGVHGKIYRNVIGRFGNRSNGTIVVGAHYDAHQKTPGADDNASGVAVLIELARILNTSAPDYEVELVAYTLEEPPFFRSEEMGSAVHAKKLIEEERDVKGMICLEMVGYFTDEKNTQDYPSDLLHIYYPGRGNFIAVIGRWDQGDWVKQVKVGMKGVTGLPIYSIRAPTSLPGVDFSDHLNYWHYDIPAVMISDTAFYRNEAYHRSGDTADTLDYDRMGEVLIALHSALLSL